MKMFEQKSSTTVNMRAIVREALGARPSTSMSRFVLFLHDANHVRKPRPTPRGSTGFVRCDAAVNIDLISALISAGLAESG
jgi:hypothetical protein